MVPMPNQKVALDEPGVRPPREVAPGSYGGTQPGSYGGTQPERESAPATRGGAQGVAMSPPAPRGGVPGDAEATTAPRPGASGDMEATPGEVLVSVDVEASGPTPGTGSLIAIGACLVDFPENGFYCEIRPVDGLPWEASAEAVHGLSREHLALRGLEPEDAMTRFAAWVDAVAGPGRAVFVGFNAPFDWMFVADYLHRFVGRNPFGISALDLKALYMGRFSVPSWSATTKRHVATVVPGSLAHTHNALDDARMQAQLARRLLEHPPTSDDR